jgi:hypothetical protein
MKTLTAFLFLITTLGYGQVFTEKINKEFTLEKKSPDNALIVANINGDVIVTGYAGDKIVVEVTKTITGKTEERLAKGKEEIQLGVIDRADTLILYVEGLCNQFGKHNNGKRSGNRWNYNWNNCNDCRPGYDYKLDFNVKVPFAMNVLISTVNDGNISIQQVKGGVRADNVNGSIKLANLTRETHASTINGDVDIEYDQNPGKECRFYSLNGDINAFFLKGLAANLSFESFNGEFYTNIDKIEYLPVNVESSKKGDGIRYKVNGNRYKVGSGGALLDFETFNGNVYLKEK